MITTLTDYHDRPSWLAARQSGIGASEVSALFGLSPWASMYSLWAEKTGLAAPLEQDEDYLTWGQLQEEPVAKFYEIRTGRKVWTGGSPYCIAQHPELSMFRCTPDRLVESAPDIGMETPGGLQIKACSWFMSSQWEEGPPPHIKIQVQAEMACTGALWWSVPVYLDGKFRNYDVMRDASMIAEIEEQVRWFWGMVESKTQPEIDGHAATTKVLKRLHPEDNGLAVDLPTDAIAWTDELLAARAEISAASRAAKKLKDGPENQLRAAIGSATYGRLPDGRVLSLRTTTREPPEEASVFRSLRLEKKGIRT